VKVHAPHALYRPLPLAPERQSFLALVPRFRRFGDTAIGRLPASLTELLDALVRRAEQVVTTIASPALDREPKVVSAITRQEVD
jgi:hypothetical protein